jgi:hypothetical protein
MNVKRGVSEAAFEAKYRRSSDPWQFAASPYEQRRYVTTLRSLSRRHYTARMKPSPYPFWSSCIVVPPQNEEVMIERFAESTAGGCCHANLT